MGPWLQLDYQVFSKLTLFLIHIKNYRSWIFSAVLKIPGIRHSKYSNRILFFPLDVYRSNLLVSRWKWFTKAFHITVLSNKTSSCALGVDSVSWRFYHRNGTRETTSGGHRALGVTTKYKWHLSSHATYRLEVMGLTKPTHL
jgi:hypothetical protein